MQNRQTIKAHCKVRVIEDLTITFDFEAQPV